MTAEENIANAHKAKPNPEEIKKAQVTAIVLAVFLIVAILAFVYALVTQTKLETQIKELQNQILVQDSLLQRANKEIEIQSGHVQVLKKALEVSKESRSKQKEAPKKGKPRKK